MRNQFASDDAARNAPKGINHPRRARARPDASSRVPAAFGARRCGPVRHMHLQPLDWHLRCPAVADVAISRLPLTGAWPDPRANDVAAIATVAITHTAILAINGENANYPRDTLDNLIWPESPNDRRVKDSFLIAVVKSEPSK